MVLLVRRSIVDAYGNRGPYRIAEGLCQQPDTETEPCEFCGGAAAENA